MTREDFTTVSIPKPLAKELDRIRKGTGFTSNSALVTQVMRDWLKETKIKGKLKLLGY